MSKKFLIIANRHHPAVGGSENVQLNLVQMLRDLGHTVDVHCTDFKFSHGNERLRAEEDSAQGIRRFHGFRIVRDPLTIAPKMFSPRLLNQYDYLYVFTYGYAVSFIPVILKTLRVIKPKIIFQPHYGPNQNLPLLAVKLFDMTLGRWTVRGSDRIVLLTEKYRSFFNSLGAKQDNIYIIPPVVPSIKEATETAISKIKQKYSIPNAEVYMLSIGRIVEYKGIQFAIIALSELRESNPAKFDKVHFVIGGSGEYEKSLRKMVEELELTMKVTFTGYLEDTERDILYNMCDIFMFLSYSGESFGIVMVEAMSCGMTIIGTHNGAVASVIKDGENGYLVDLDDNTLLRTLEICIDKNILENYREKNIVEAQQYSYTNIKNRYSQLIDQLP